MSGTDPVITLAYLLKFEAPDGDVRLCDGGFLDFSSERYEAAHAVFGTVHEPGPLDAMFGDMAESGTLIFAPDPDATLTDWWRADLANCRVRIWLGELDSDLLTVSTAKQLADMVVDTISREQSAGGVDLLQLGLIGRPEKFFLKNQGNVCSQRFHQTVYAGEKGFNNCTDLRGFVPWGAASPPRSSGGGGSVPSTGGLQPVGPWQY